jgi:hypothetical protein
VKKQFIGEWLIGGRGLTRGTMGTDFGARPVRGINFLC